MNNNIPNNKNYNKATVMHSALRAVLTLLQG